MSSKRCFKCLQVLPLTAFYKHAQMGDGHLNKCKECTKKDTILNRVDRIEYYRSYDRRRAALPHRVAARTEYKQTASGKLARARANRKYHLEHPERKAATTAVHNAIRDGRLEKMPCFVCGVAAQAHHPDYDRPLDVVWLCVKHHRETHALAEQE